MFEKVRIMRDIRKCKERQRYLRNQWLDMDLKLSVLNELFEKQKLMN